MLLTISMIVKNEEKYLERCLNGIKPILDNVDSELIITDTGSTDRTVEIAKQFTDKVIHFDWINDFAAARNCGLQRACGEWFMFLDADETFESCNGIIHFFKSGEYKKYDLATVILRSLIDPNGQYFDMTVCRLAKITSDIKFERAVHEHFSNVDGYIHDICDIAVHYGYLYNDKEEAKRKARRNLEILLEEENNSVNDPLIYLQIYDSYILADENDKALEYLEKGIDYCRNNKNILLSVYYCSKAIHFIRTGNKNAVIEICEKYFDKKEKIIPHPITADMEMYAIKASVLYEQLNFSEACSAYKKYFMLFSEFKNGNLMTAEVGALVLRMSAECNYIKHLCSFLDCCISIQDFKTALYHIGVLPIYEYNVSEDDMPLLIEKEYVILEHYNFEYSARCYNRLEKIGKQLFIRKLINSLEDTDIRKYIISALNEIGKNEVWLREKVGIYESYYLSDETSEEMISKYIEKYGIMQDIDLIKIIMEKGYDLSIAFDAKDLDLKRCAYLCCHYLNGFYETAENYLADHIRKAEAFDDAVKFYEYLISVRLMDNEDKTDEEKQELIKKLFRVKSDILSLKNNSATEFEKLALAVKKNIRAFIANGDIAAAKKNLDEYRKINPNDSEINELDKQITNV